MRIGQGDQHLSIERVSDDPYSPFRVEASGMGRHCHFSAWHDSVLFEDNKETIEKIRAFADWKTKEVEIKMTERGWIRVEREARGYLAVRYRLASYKTETAIDGTLRIDAEFAGAFCQDLLKLLQKKGGSETGLG